MSNANKVNILKVNSSGRTNGSYSRKLVDHLVNRLISKNPNANVTSRDVSTGSEFVDEEWINSNFTQENERSDSQRQRLAGSDKLVDELIDADILVVAVPIYNFGIPAALKAWVDQIARVGRTFSYSETGPQGLLTGKKAYVIITSGGTEMDSDIDFATGYMRHILGFLGISDVDVIPADQLMMDEEAKLVNAHKLIAAA